MSANVGPWWRQQVSRLTAPRHLARQATSARPYGIAHTSGTQPLGIFGSVDTENHCGMTSLVR